MQVIFGAYHLDRAVADVAGLLIGYQSDSGSRYLDHTPCTPPDKVVPEDLAITMLVNSRFGSAAVAAVQDRGDSLDIAALPDRPLEATSDADRNEVAEVLAEVARWPGFAASLASKVLHKKRPDLVPIIDNQAIFGAYMNPGWPDRPSLADSVHDVATIRGALDWIATDLTRPDNTAAWDALASIEPRRTRIELFDMVWWMYFRRVEPIRSPERTAAASTSAVVNGAGHSARPAAGRVTARVTAFVDDEQGYLRWLQTHPRGYVLNTYRVPAAGYLMLHRATCGLISGTPPRGNLWTKNFSKVCSMDRAALSEWAEHELAGTLTSCHFCAL